MMKQTKVEIFSLNFLFQNWDFHSFQCSSKVDRTQGPWKDMARYGKQLTVACSGLLLSFLFTFVPFSLLLLLFCFNTFSFFILFQCLPLIPCIAMQTSALSLVKPLSPFWAPTQLAKPQGTATDAGQHMLTPNSSAVTPVCVFSAGPKSLTCLTCPLPSPLTQRQEKQRRGRPKEICSGARRRSANTPHLPQRFHST